MILSWILILFVMVFFVYEHIYILHQNINGLVNKSDLLSVHLNDFLDKGKSVDIVCITETNMKKNDHMHLHLPNYTLYTYYARDNRYGGSCILMKNTFKGQKLDVEK